jgi:hypothetical protein
MRRNNNATLESKNKLENNIKRKLMGEIKMGQRSLIFNL